MKRMGVHLSQGEGAFISRVIWAVLTEEKGHLSYVKNKKKTTFKILHGQKGGGTLGVPEKVGALSPCHPRSAASG